MKSDYKGWKNALKLTNGTVEVVVVPSVGRVMHYGFVGGPNLLWENPAALGKPTPVGYWTNTGGDKVWPWPQDDWGKRVLNAWPPPAALDQAPHTGELLGPLTAQLTSSLVIGYGLRCVRTIQLAPTGTQLTLTTVFHKERDGANFPVAPWAITQVPATALAWGRYTGTPTLPGGFKAGEGLPSAVERTPQGLLRHTRDPKKATKIFFEGDLLATLQDDTLFTVRRLPSPGNTALPYAPGDQAQLYSNVDPAYLELEFTAPLTVLKKSETTTLVTRYEAVKLTKDGRSEADLARVILS